MGDNERTKWWDEGEAEYANEAVWHGWLDPSELLPEELITDSGKRLMFKDVLLGFAGRNDLEEIDLLRIVMSLDFKMFGPSHNKWIASLVDGNVEPFIKQVGIDKEFGIGEENADVFLRTLNNVLQENQSLLKWTVGAPGARPYNNLRNWLKMRVMQNTIEGVGIRDGNGWIDNYDCDACIKEPELRAYLGWYNLNGWHEDVDEIPWIDCIYSMQSYLRRFLLLYLDAALPEWENKQRESLGQLLEGGDIDSLSAPQRKALDDVWLLQNFDDLFSAETVQRANEVLDGCGIESCITQLDSFALNTHTLGNYMPCPDRHYNCRKGSYLGPYNDRIDLILASVSKSETEATWQKWFDARDANGYLILEAFNKYRESFVLSEYIQPPEAEEMKYQPAAKKCFDPEDIAIFTNYLAWVNDAIRWRSVMLAQRLVPEISDNVYWDTLWEDARLRGIPFHKVNKRNYWGIEREDGRCSYGTIGQVASEFCHFELNYPYDDLSGKWSRRVGCDEFSRLLRFLILDPKSMGFPDDCKEAYSTQEWEFIKRFQAALLERLEDLSAEE